jgi:TolB protein
VSAARRSGKWGRRLTLLALFATALAGATSGGGAVGLVKNGRIVFSGTSGQSSKTSIYVMKADGSAQKRIAAGFDPTWSPDGKLIAFVNDANDNAHDGAGIYVMRGDGSRRRLIAHVKGLGFDLAWSPDGRHIAFESNDSRSFQIYVITTDGSPPTRITKRMYDAVYPAWSPDGRRLAVAGRLVADEDPRIYLMNADGSDLKLLVHGNTPSWSPDGTTIAFHDADGGISLIKTDGSAQKQITHGQQEFRPAWSPDGRKIAFDSDRRIHVVNVDGSNRKRLTDHFSLAADWQRLP